MRFYYPPGEEVRGKEGRERGPYKGQESVVFNKNTGL